MIHKISIAKCQMEFKVNIWDLQEHGYHTFNTVDVIKCLHLLCQAELNTEFGQNFFIQCFLLHFLHQNFCICTFNTSYLQHLLITQEKKKKKKRK